VTIVSFRERLFHPKDPSKLDVLISPSRMNFYASSMTSTTVEPLFDVSVPPSTKTSTCAKYVFAS